MGPDSEQVEKVLSEPLASNEQERLLPAWGGAKPCPCDPGPMLFALWEPLDVERSGKRFNIMLGDLLCTLL